MEKASRLLSKYKEDMSKIQEPSGNDEAASQQLQVMLQRTKVALSNVSASSVKRATKLGGNSNRDTESGYYKDRKERLRACSRKVSQIFRDINLLHQHTGCIGGAFFMPETLHIRQHTTGNRDFDATYLAVANTVAFVRAFKKPIVDFDINAVVDAYNHDDGLLLMQTAASLFRDCGVGDETITALQEEVEYALVSEPTAGFKAQLGVHLTAAAKAFAQELKKQREAAAANGAEDEEDEEEQGTGRMDADVEHKQSNGKPRKKRAKQKKRSR